MVNKETLHALAATVLFGRFVGRQKKFFVPVRATPVLASCGMMTNDDIPTISDGIKCVKSMRWVDFKGPDEMVCFG